MGALTLPEIPSFKHYRHFFLLSDSATPKLMRLINSFERFYFHRIIQTLESSLSLSLSLSLSKLETYNFDFILSTNIFKISFYNGKQQYHNLCIPSVYKGQDLVLAWIIFGRQGGPFTLLIVVAWGEQRWSSHSFLLVNALTL